MRDEWCKAGFLVERPLLAWSVGERHDLVLTEVPSDFVVRSGVLGGSRFGIAWRLLSNEQRAFLGAVCTQEEQPRTVQHAAHAGHYHVLPLLQGHVAYLLG